jgi:hypothetical protein
MNANRYGTSMKSSIMTTRITWQAFSMQGRLVHRAKEMNTEYSTQQTKHVKVIYRQGRLDRCLVSSNQYDDGPT